MVLGVAQKYMLSPNALNDIYVPARGTTVTLHLKPDEDEFLDGWRLRSLVSRYSDHIGFPIRMPKEADGSGDAEVVNQAAALWTRPKAAVKDEEYRDFYKYLAHDTEDPLAWACGPYSHMCGCVRWGRAGARCSRTSSTR